jgi:serine O-acetyltransferase
MKSSVNPVELEAYCRRLVANHIPDGYVAGDNLGPLLDKAFARLEHCFSSIHRKYYEEEGRPVFDHLNGDHFASLLYFLANTIWRETGDTQLPTRLFYLNKIMHGLDLFYSVPMPDIFMLVHPLGTVLGKAQYGNYLVVYQNCTIGANTDIYPKFGEGTIVYSRSSIIGNCEVGDNVVFGANSFLVNTHVPRDTVVTGQYPAQRFLPNRRSVRAFSFDAVVNKEAP